MFALALSPSAVAVALRPRHLRRLVLALGLAFGRAENSQYVSLGF